MERTSEIKDAAMQQTRILADYLTDLFVNRKKTGDSPDYTAGAQPFFPRKKAGGLRPLNRRDVKRSML
jgi:hypothetical protein